MSSIAAVKIDAGKIPPLERRLLGKAAFEAMERFYANPDNLRRFEEWLTAKNEGHE